MHPNGALAATGQAGTAPFACVWDTRTSELLASLRTAHSVGVCAISFHPSGTLLASCGLEPSHCVALWDWARGAMLYRVSTGFSRVFGAAFRPAAPAEEGPPSIAMSAQLPPRGVIEVAVCGTRCLTFISYIARGDGSPDAPPRTSRGAWRGRAVPSALLCVAFSRAGEECYSGTSSGDIVAWAGREVVRVVKAHSGPVLSLTLAPVAVAAAAGERELLYSVGKGGKLRTWGPTLRAVGCDDLRQPFAAICDGWGRPLAFRGEAPVVRSVSVSASGRVLLATSGGEVRSATQAQAGPAQACLL